MGSAKDRGASTAAEGQDMGYVGNVTGATHYDHSKGLNSLAAFVARSEAV